MKKIAVLSSVIALLVWGFAYMMADGDIQLNPKLEEALREQVNVKHVDKRNVANIQKLDLKGYELTSIEGLQHFTSLQEIDLSENVLVDVTPLQNLKNLTSVNLSFNQLDHIELNSPNLTDLRLEGNRLKDLAFLDGMKKLTTLDIRDNDVKDITPIASLTNLTKLNIRGNQIKSIEALARLTNLTDLNMRKNQIQDLTPILQLPLTDRLYVEGNGIKDFNPLKDIVMRSKETDFELGMAPPTISKESGYYDKSFHVEMQAGEGEKVYYTTDGSEPNLKSNVYESPVEISKEMLNQKKVYANVKTSPRRGAYDFKPEDVQEAITIKAAAYRSGKFSPSVVATYIMKDDLFNRANLPVISLVTAPENLFDEQEGMYVPGVHYDEGYDRSGNYHQRGRETEKQAYMMYFEPDGSLGFEIDIGLRIHGSFTRQLPQKSLRVYPRSEYGQSRIYHPIFKGKEQEEFDQLLLRNSGNDFYFTMLRDGMMQKLIDHRGVVDTQDFRPSIVLINGEYWGIHNIRERFTEEYLELKYNVRSSEITLLKADASEESAFEVSTGNPQDVQHYLQMVDYVNEHDMTENEHLEYVRTQMDVENYLEYVAYQVYYGNMDSFTNNTALWRKKVDYTPEAPKGHDGRWRWMLYDTDFGMGLREIDDSYNQETLMWVQRDHPSVDLFRGIIKNEDAKTYFINTMLDLLNSSFSTDFVSTKISQYAKMIEKEMPYSINRWENIDSMEEWRENLNTLYEFAEKRPDVLKNHLIRRLHLDKNRYVNLTVNAEDDAIEHVKVNSLTLDSKEVWEGEYLAGIPIQLEVKMVEGRHLRPVEGMEKVEQKEDGTNVYNVELVSDRAITLMGNE